MKPQFSLIVVILSAFGAISAARAAGIDGKWAAEFDTQVGVQKYVFEFRAEGEKLTGKATWWRMEIRCDPFIEGKIADGTVTFVELMTFQDMDVPIAYTGKLAGDELRFTRVVGDFATEDFVAKRVVAEAAAAPTPTLAASPTHLIASGPFQPAWDSLSAHYQFPEWFRDAKFGIWAHWSAQCVPEQGDWYARNMYIQGMPQYDYHVAHYGPPSSSASWRSTISGRRRTGIRRS